MKSYHKGALSGLRQFLVTEIHLQIMKNAFYFTLKTLFVLKIFKFLSWIFLSCRKTARLEDFSNFKFYDVRTWLTNNAIHILANNWRSKDNQTMNFGQLIEHNMRKIFIEKSYTKCGGETNLRSYPKKSKLIISLDQQSKVLYSLIVLHAKLRAFQVY